ncbi:hypothetical protein [Sphingomonas guangdongensis]|nr:hypothetical protein [Sphingomonas guangdongensis]
MLYLLGRIDGKLDGVVTQLNAMSSRQDDHDNRITALENTQADRPIYIEQHKKMIEKVAKLEEWKTEIAGAVKAGAFLKTAVAIMAAIILYVGYRVQFAPIQTSKVTTTHQVQSTVPHARVE